jgi:Methyltransferase domain
MLSDTVRNLIGRFSHHPSAHPLGELVFAEPDTEVHSEVTVRKVEPTAQVVWPPARLALADQLWGSGFVFPGGEIETLRLARPLGASAATSLPIVGVGSGGPASSVARNMGTWVTGMESDPSLRAAACKLFTKTSLGKKVSIKAWDPANPDFVARSHHHCLALEALAGAQPEPILDGLARVLKPGGQLVLTELTAAAPLDQLDPTVIRWSALEKTRSGRRAGGHRRHPHVGSGRAGCSHLRGHLHPPHGAGHAGLASDAARAARPQTYPARGNSNGLRSRVVAIAAAVDPQWQAADDAVARDEPRSDLVIRLTCLR